MANDRAEDERRATERGRAPTARERAPSARELALRSELISICHDLRALLAEAPLLEEDREAHVDEHAIEVLLPLLVARQPALRIAPIVFGGLSFEECEAVAAGIAMGTLTLHAWVYEFETGSVYGYDSTAAQFVPLGDVKTPVSKASARAVDVRSGEVMG